MAVSEWAFEVYIKRRFLLKFMKSLVEFLMAMAIRARWFWSKGITLLKIKTGHLYSCVTLNFRANLFSCIFLICIIGKWTLLAFCPYSRKTAQKRSKLYEDKHVIHHFGGRDVVFKKWSPFFLFRHSKWQKWNRNKLTTYPCLPSLQPSHHLNSIKKAYCQTHFICHSKDGWHFGTG